MNGKIVVILGPTSSGKSSLAIKLAQKFNGEIISADSRQVYAGLDIGTGKISKKEQQLVPHHLLDIASPKRQFTVSQFKKLGLKALAQIQKRNRLPIIAGGTAFYVYSIIDDLKLPEVKPNPTLRKQLEQKTTAQLISLLQKLDKARASKIDANNRRRIVRAIEIIKTTGKPIPSMEFTYPNHNSHILILGIQKNLPQLFKLIDDRLEQRVKKGLTKETKKLLASGLTHKKLEGLGLEYRIASQYIRGQFTKSQMLDELKRANHNFAKRQMTWFKRDPRIIWIKTEAQASAKVKSFLKRP